MIRTYYVPDGIDYDPRMDKGLCHTQEHLSYTLERSQQFISL
jgi:hypothetical protein